MRVRVPIDREMARRKGKTGQPSAGQIHPDGPLVTVSEGERTKLRDRRLELGWTQLELAKKAKTTQPTIANIESGRTEQPKKFVYVRIKRALYRGHALQGDVDTDAGYLEMVDKVQDLQPLETKAVNDLIDSLKQLRQPKT